MLTSLKAIFDNIGPWFTLLRVFLFGFAFVLTLVFLPFCGASSRMLGGFFQELTSWEVFFSSVAYVFVFWSLMVVQGLLIDAYEQRHPNSLPPSCAKHLSVPVTGGQVAIYFALACIGLLATVCEAKNFKMAILAAAAALALVVVCLVCIAPFVQKKGVAPLFRSGSCPALVRFSESDHLTALLGAMLTLFILAILAIYFEPGGSRQAAPAQVHLWLVVVSLIWVVGLVDFWLSWIGLPTGLTILIVSALTFQFQDIDHTFRIFQTTPSRSVASSIEPTQSALADSGAAEKPLTPMEVAVTSTDNLVVVAAPGGGIQAAAWTTKVLHELHEQRSELDSEIRAISSTSGGSVGTAFYLTARRFALDEPNGRNPSDSTSPTLKAHNNATVSSLSDVVYGLAFRDIPRVPVELSKMFVPVCLETRRVIGRTYDWFEEDRGALLEQSWRRAAGIGNPKNTDPEDTDPTILMRRDLKNLIRSGKLPAPIFNTAVMETGRRVMITPVDFSIPEEAPGIPFDFGDDWPRAKTLFEYIASDSAEAASLDVDLFTAARLSANFPWVGPAARADQVVDCTDEATVAKMQNACHHFIDGGYHDNYGVSSVIDFLRPVLEQRDREQQDTTRSTLSFKRVLVIQILNANDGLTRNARPQSGFVTALLGPVVGAISSPFGTAAMRNQAELDRFLDEWNVRLNRVSSDSVDVRTVTFQPQHQSNSAAPLSWHLTPTQKDELDTQWANSDGEEKVEWVVKFLKGQVPPRAKDRP